MIGREINLGVYVFSKTVESSTHIPKTYKDKHALS